MAIATGDKKTIQLSCKRLSYIVLTMCSLATGYAGWELAEGHPIKTIVFVTLMGVMPWAAARLLPSIAMARAAGRPLAAFGLSVVFMGAVVAEWIGETMVFAGQRQTTSINAQMQQMRYVDARNAVTNLEAQLAAAQKQLDDQIPYGTSASYTARIQEAEALAQRESSKQRGGCRAKCDNARKEAAKLRSDQAIALDRETRTEVEVKRLTAELAKARATAGSTQAGNSIADASSGLIAMISTGSLNPTRDSKQWANIGLGTFLATVLTIVGLGLSYAAVTDWDAPKPVRKRPVSRFANARARFMAWLKGEPYVAPAGTGDTYIKVDNQDRSGEIWQGIHRALNRPKLIA